MARPKKYSDDDLREIRRVTAKHGGDDALHYAEGGRDEPTFLKFYRLLELLLPWDGAPGVLSYFKYFQMYRRVGEGESESAIPKINDFLGLREKVPQALDWLMELLLVPSDLNQSIPVLKRGSKPQIICDGYATDQAGKRYVFVPHFLDEGNSSWTELVFDCRKGEARKLEQTFRSLVRHVVPLMTFMSGCGWKHYQRLYDIEYRKTGAHISTYDAVGIAFYERWYDQHINLDLLYPLHACADAALAEDSPERSYSRVDPYNLEVHGALSYSDLLNRYVSDDGAVRIELHAAVCLALYRVIFTVLNSSKRSGWQAFYRFQRRVPLRAGKRSLEGLLACMICDRPMWRPKPGKVKAKRSNIRDVLQCCSEHCERRFRAWKKQESYKEFKGYVKPKRDESQAFLYWDWRDGDPYDPNGVAYREEISKNQRDEDRERRDIEDRTNEAIVGPIRSIQELERLRESWSIEDKAEKPETSMFSLKPSRKRQLICMMLQGIEPEELASIFNLDEKGLRGGLKEVRDAINKAAANRVRRRT